MTDSLKIELLEILRSEKKLYEELFEAAQGKKEALINNDVDMLMEEIEVDQQVIPKIEAESEKRNQLIEKVKQKFGIELDKNSYRELFKKLPEDWSKEFDPLREDILELTEEFDALNHANQRLLEQALQLNQISLNTILDNVKNDNTTYSNPGDGAEQPRILNKQG